MMVTQQRVYLTHISFITAVVRRSTMLTIMNYHLAIDQGTHASRAILYNQSGNVLAREMQNIALSRRQNNHIEQQADEILQSIIRVQHRLLASLPAKIRKQIRSCGIACQRSTVLACNQQGEPLSAAISWQDVRGEHYLDDLTISPQQIQKISGLPCSAHYGASKLRWLLDNSPRVKKQSIDNLYLAPLISYLLFHLAQTKPGKPQFVVDHSQAQRMQLWNMKTLDWSDRLLQAFKIPRNTLPQCRPMQYDYGYLGNTRTPIRAVGGDQNAALLGAMNGKIDTTTALINLGSGAFVLQPLPSLQHSSRLLTSITCSSAGTIRYCREATVNGAGNALNWLAQQDLFTQQPWRSHVSAWLDQSLHDETMETLFINTVGGLGSPWWSAKIPPHFINATQAGKRELCVAVIESIIFLLQENLDMMSKAHPIQRCILSGGLAEIDALCQKIANLSQLPVQQLRDKESTARGIAWLSASSPPWCDTKQKTFYPAKEPGLRRRYRQFHTHLTALMTSHEQ